MEAQFGLGSILSLRTRHRLNWILATRSQSSLIGEETTEHFSFSQLKHLNNPANKVEEVIDRGLWRDDSFTFLQ